MARANFKPKQSIEELPPEAVPEVVDFIIAEQELSDYVEEIALKNPGLLEGLQQLAERRNAALEAAGKAVRAREMPCGPFEVHQIRTEYDADALYDAVGEERFLELGGSIETKRILCLDSKRFEAAMSFNRVGAEVVRVVKTRKVTFKQLPKVWGA